MQSILINPTLLDYKNLLDAVLVIGKSMSFNVKVSSYAAF